MSIDGRRRDLHGRAACRISFWVALRNPGCCAPFGSLRAFGAWMVEAAQSYCCVGAETGWQVYDCTCQSIGELTKVAPPRTSLDAVAKVQRVTVTHVYKFG